MGQELPIELAQRDPKQVEDGEGRPQTLARLGTTTVPYADRPRGSVHVPLSMDVSGAWLIATLTSQTTSDQT